MIQTNLHLNSYDNIEKIYMEKSIRRASWPRSTAAVLLRAAGRPALRLHCCIRAFRQH